MAALVCSECLHINPQDALYCENCWTALANPPSDAQGPTSPMNESSADVHAAGKRQKVNRKAHLGKLDSRSIALYIDFHSEPLILALDGQIALGRATLLDTQPLLDLSPFGAGDKGVSRQHCVLRRSDSGVMVQDMGSTNGTWIDDVPLQPYEPRLISTGTRLRLAGLELEVYLPE